MRTGAWESVENAAAAAREAAGRLADRIMSLFRDGRDRDDLTRAQVRIDQALSRHLDRGVSAGLNRGRIDKPSNVIIFLHEI